MFKSVKGHFVKFMNFGSRYVPNPGIEIYSVIQTFKYFDRRIGNYSFQKETFVFRKSLLIQCQRHTLWFLLLLVEIPAKNTQE